MQNFIEISSVVFVWLNHRQMNRHQLISIIFIRIIESPPYRPRLWVGSLSNFKKYKQSITTDVCVLQLIFHRVLWLHSLSFSFLSYLAGQVGASKLCGWEPSATAAVERGQCRNAITVHVKAADYAIQLISSIKKLWWTMLVWVTQLKAILPCRISQQGGS